MKEKPILFNSEMVRAILDGRKTQTRRIVKVQPPEGFNYPIFDNTRGCWMDIPDDSFGDCWPEEPMLMPYQVGDRLWVRETVTRSGGSVKYVADGHVTHKPWNWDWKRDLIPSIHMPRWASRITLEVVAVRVERLQDISEDDACAEGAQHLNRPGIDVDIDGDVWNGAYYRAFKRLWNTINGKRAPWASNPWVWVVEFKKVKE